MWDVIVVGLYVESVFPRDVHPDLTVADHCDNDQHAGWSSQRLAHSALIMWSLMAVTARPVGYSTLRMDRCQRR